MPEDDHHKLEALIGYHFHNRQLLQEALTHKSFSNEQPGRFCPHNERLEFLGDAVLDLVVSHRIFGDYPQVPEGEMTRIRAEVVSEKSLARVGRKLGLGECLRLGRGEARSGGRNKDSLIADAFEALLGAVFCDGGLEGARVLSESMLGRAIVRSARSKAGIDHKTRLQEILQAQGGRPPRYVLVKAEGPDHQRFYTVEVVADDRVVGQGRGKTKKAAEQEAARQALEQMGE